MFENKCLRRKFRHKAEKGRAGQKNLPENELYNLYTSPRLLE